MREFHASYEYDLEPEAENNTAASIYKLAREGGPRVLDLGSGPGIVSAYLKGAHGKIVTCVDSDPGRLEAARVRGVEQTIVADLEGDEWADKLAGERFDVIILADVLEHLVHPGTVFDRIHDRKLLAPGGFFVVSIPNASHEAIVAELMSGELRYRSAGLLDSTHVRFFTKESFSEFCERHGCVVTRLHRTKRTLEQTEFAAHARSIPPEVRAHLASVPESQTYQFVMRVEPVDPERRVTDLREQIDALKEERTRLSADVDRYRRDAIRHRETIEAVRAQHANAEALLREQTSALTKSAEGYQTRLQEIYASRSWKTVRLGSFLGRSVRHPRWAYLRLKARRTRKQPGAVAAAVAPAAQARRPVILAEYTLTEDARMRDVYLAALAKRRFAGTGRRLAMSVSTLEPDEGRGDVYTAVGLGRYLERIGYDVVYLPRERWYEVPERTEIYLSLLDEVDPAGLPLDCLRIAWVRNSTNEWLDSPNFALYDGVLCSSDRSLVEVRRTYAGPAGVLAIGVDIELFAGSDPKAPRGGAVTTVNQWGRERQLFRNLVRSRLDFPLAIYGEQRGLHPDLQPYWKGKTSFFALPSLYRQAAVVLDDHNHTTLPFGNVNSRIFESLACGAPVITNASIGMREIGLGDVPSFVTPEELETHVHRTVSAAAEAMALARRLREIVVRDHSYERRAAQFDAFLKGAFDGERTAARTTVGFYPDYRSTNPYQRMLYSAGTEGGLTAVAVPHPAQLVGTRLAKLGSRFIFHLHWTATILGPATTEEEARERAAEFVAALDELKREGALVVWTVHNVLSHECRFMEVEAQLCQQIADRADAIHVMCEATAELVSASYTLPASKLRLIPHPGYVGVYPNLITQDAARAELGLRPEQTVLAFFGGIRPYKGLEELLDAFEHVSQVSPETRLLVVGPPGRFPEVEQLRDRCEANPAIVASFNRAADADVQLYLNAADAVVLPHRAVLNSGSVMLAFSFARPVIAPATGCVKDLLTPDVAITFDPERPQELRDALLRAAELKQERFRKAALAKAEAYPVRGIAEQFASLVRDLTDRDAAR